MDIYTTTPNSIINVYGTHVDSMIDGTNEKVNFCMVPHYFYEFNNDPKVEVIEATFGMRSRGHNFITVPDHILRNHLLKVTNSDTKLVFDNLHEGNVLPFVNKIYRCIDGTNIREDQIYYFTGALDGEEILKEFCRTTGKKLINIYGANSWEYNTKKSSQINKLTDIVYNIKTKQKTFLCFNRVLRWHRLLLTALLTERDLIKDSFYSFFKVSHHTSLDPQKNVDYMLHSLKEILSAETFNVLAKIAPTLNSEIRLNIDPYTNKNFLTQDDITYFDESYFSLVTETFFFKKTQYKVPDEQTIFFTEKIFKPIAMMHPFIIASRPHSLKWLRKMKYKTFHPYIDESYDDIENDEERLFAIIKEVERLNNFTNDQWIEWQHNIKSIVEHNHQIFYNKAKHEYAFSRPTL